MFYTLKNGIKSTAAAVLLVFSLAASATIPPDAQPNEDPPAYANRTCAAMQSCSFAWGGFYYTFTRQTYTLPNGDTFSYMSQTVKVPFPTIEP
ncbi:MAG: hypothetical protein AAF683_03795 [Pseudomonadota bacterium]